MGTGSSNVRTEVILISPPPCFPALSDFTLWANFLHIYDKRHGLWQNQNFIFLGIVTLSSSVYVLAPEKDLKFL